MTHQDPMNTVAESPEQMDSASKKTVSKQEARQDLQKVRGTGDVPARPTKLKTRIVKTKKVSIFTAPMITSSFVIHFALVCISFNFYLLNMGISLQQANVGLLLLDVIKPLIFALVIAPILMLARHGDFKEEYKTTLFIGCGLSILYALLQLLGVF